MATVVNPNRSLRLFPQVNTEQLRYKVTKALSDPKPQSPSALTGLATAVRCCNKILPTNMLTNCNRTDVERRDLHTDYVHTFAGKVFAFHTASWLQQSGDFFRVKLHFFFFCRPRSRRVVKVTNREIYHSLHLSGKVRMGDRK